MGNKYTIKAKHSRRRAGKVDTPFNEELKNVRWGEFGFDKLFKVCPVKNKLTKIALDSDGKIPVYSSDSSNNGILGFTNEEAEFIISKDNPVYIVFGDHTRSFNIATESFCVMDNVKVLAVNEVLSVSGLLFIISSWKKCIPNKGYSRHWSTAKNVLFKLPLTQDNKIDFDFIECFVKELEAVRIDKLDAYLLDNNLKDYILTIKEEQVLNIFKNIEWGKFRLGVLFKKIETKKLSFQADELPKQIIGKYTLPCLTSSFKNQGLNYFVPKVGVTILKNVISIPSNSDIYRAYFQSNEFTVLSDAYAISWVFDGVKLLPNQYLFAVQCINKVTDLSIYSYKNKLGGWNVVKNKYIQLPIKNDKPDFEIMDTLISAIKKLVIKEVVLYVDRKIATTKNSVSKN